MSATTSQPLVEQERATSEPSGALEAFEAERALLDCLSRIAPALASELDAERLMQRLTDEATSVVGAQLGAFFHNVEQASGKSFLLYTLTGAPREALEQFGTPGGTAVFSSTFAGEGVVRSDDVTKDPRYGPSSPPFGMPTLRLPVVSYLAVSVRSMSGKVIGGLFFGHARAGMFSEREERAALALSALAGAALDNARLFETLSEREAALHAANQHHQLVFQATREGLWFWDVASNTVEWNDALLDAIGISRADWGGTFDDWFRRVHPEDQPRLAGALKAHLERREPYLIELFRLRHASGDYHWFTTAGQAAWDADGRPLRMAGSVRDVTAKKLAEDALRASEHRNAQILDSIGEMVFCKNEQLAMVYANAAACRHYGMTAEQLRGITDVSYDTIDFAEQENADDREVLEKRRVIERDEERNLSATGEIRYFHTIKSPIFDRDGNVRELVGVSRDVTERRRALDEQRKLAEASAILARSIDYDDTLANVAGAMVPAFADWCAVDVVENGAARRIAVAHTDPEKVQLAYELQRRWPARSDSEVGAAAVLRSGRPQLVENIPDEMLAAAAVDAEHLATLRTLGLKAYIVVPMKAQGRVLGAISLVAEGSRRFTEQDLAFAEELARRAATALENALLYQEVRDLNASLEQRVEERTFALVEANKELEAFSYTVSHDLRAPIRHVAGFADLLRAHAEGALDDKGLHYVDTIRQAAAQMGALIDGLLAFSRLGRAELSKRCVDLGEIVDAVIREQASDTEEREVTWRVGAMPSVAADATMLRVVLSNLIANSVKYTRKRQAAVIEIGAERQEHAVLIWVRDNGTGFNMEYMSKLFGVFQRLHSDDEFQGTGIGLATARRIVHRHGGRIWAESVLGQGSTFFFTLPYAKGTHE